MSAVDVMKPWSIKSVATRTQNIATAAARRENLTVGQWLEKRIDEWEGQGSPEQRALPTLGDLATLLTAAGAMAQHTKLPGEIRTLINETARMARGLPAQKPGHTDAPRLSPPPKPQVLLEQSDDERPPAAPATRRVARPTASAARRASG